MLTTTVSLDQLVDRALLDVVAPDNQGAIVVVDASNTITSTSDTTVSFVDSARVNISDVLEYGFELMLVTAKTTDPIPVLTVSRGYYNTTKASTIPAGSVILVNPAFPRVRIAEGVKRSFARLEALGLPLRRSAVFQRDAGLSRITLPADTRQVLRVSYEDQYGHWWNLDRWSFVDDIPTATVSTGKALQLPSYVANTDSLQVLSTYPYRWSTFPAAPDGAATVTMQEGAEELPSMYAAGFLLSRREVSRTDLDVAQEWNRSEPIRNGASGAVVRAIWAEFYRSLDEARRLDPAPVHRPFIKMRSIR